MYSLTFYFYKTFYYMGNKVCFDKYFTEIILISIKNYVNVILYVSKQSYLFLKPAKANMQGMACVFQCTERVGNYSKEFLYFFKKGENFSILLHKASMQGMACVLQRIEQIITIYPIIIYVNWNTLGQMLSHWLKGLNIRISSEIQLIYSIKHKIETNYLGAGCGGVAGPEQGTTCSASPLCYITLAKYDKNHRKKQNSTNLNRSANTNREKHPLETLPEQGIACCGRSPSYADYQQITITRLRPLKNE